MRASARFGDRARFVGGLGAVSAIDVGPQVGIAIESARATRQEVNAPRTWELPNGAINRLLWTPEGFSLAADQPVTLAEAGATVEVTFVNDETPPEKERQFAGYSIEVKTCWTA